MLTRISEDAIDTLPHEAARFADPRLPHLDASDEQMIEAALVEITERIVRASRSLVLYPNHVELQRSFAKLVGQRDALAQHLADAPQGVA